MKTILINHEEGYTLIETLIAMALFLSVLIPLISVFGKIANNRSGFESEKALLLAQNEMNTIEINRLFIDAVKELPDGFIADRKIVHLERELRVSVTICKIKNSEKTIVKLYKSFLKKNNE